MSLGCPANCPYVSRRAARVGMRGLGAQPLMYDSLQMAQSMYNFFHDAFAPTFGGSVLTDSEKQRLAGEASAAIAYAAGVNNPNAPHSPELDAQYLAVAKGQTDQLVQELGAVFTEADQPPAPSPAAGNFVILAVIAGLGLLIFSRS